MAYTSLALLATTGATHQQAATTNALANYDDAVTFPEDWANLSAWSSSTFGQVSGGRLYSAAQGGNSGANHAFPVPAGANFRAVFNVRTVSGLTSGGLAVGVSKDAAGAAPAAGVASARAIYFRADIVQMDQGVTSILPDSQRTTAGTLTTGVPAGTTDWLVTVSADADFFSIAARSVDGAHELRTKWARDEANFPIRNLYVFNSDSRQLTGHSVGLIGARNAIATVAPRAGVEDVAHTVHWTTVNGARIRVAAPKGYDSRKATPLAIMFHGYTSDEAHFQTNANGHAVAKAFTDAGYITVSAANNANINTWGADAGLNTYVTAYNYVRARYNVGPVVLYGNSMGGLESLLTLAGRRIPGVVAWVGTVPVSNLDTAHGSADFAASIRAAYGAASDGSDYEAKAAGHNPVDMQGYEFRGVPMWVLVATDDTAVPPAGHFDLLQPVVEPFSTELVRVNVTGGHSTGQITSRAGEMVAFADKYVK